MLAAMDMDPGVICIGLPVLVLAIAFWVSQFAQLMLLSDHDFPGRYDKILWFIAFMLFHVFAAFAFLLWKRAALVVRTPGAGMEREEPSAPSAR